MSATPVPPLSTMKHARVAVTVATLFLRVTIEVVGPDNIINLVLAGIRAAAARWPAAVTVSEH